MRRDGQVQRAVPAVRRSGEVHRHVPFVRRFRMAQVHAVAGRIRTFRRGVLMEGIVVFIVIVLVIVAVIYNYGHKTGKREGSRKGYGVGFSRGRRAGSSGCLVMVGWLLSLLAVTAICAAA